MAIEDRYLTEANDNFIKDDLKRQTDDVIKTITSFINDKIKILEKYMPEQMGEDQIKEITKAVIAEMGATVTDFGKVMKAVMEKVKGKADGSLVSKAVKELLK